jgi:hypothetical protein
MSVDCYTTINGLVALRDGRSVIYRRNQFICRRTTVNRHQSASEILKPAFRFCTEIKDSLGFFGYHLYGFFNKSFTNIDTRIVSAGQALVELGVHITRELNHGIFRFPEEQAHSAIQSEKQPSALV